MQTRDAVPPNSVAEQAAAAAEKEGDNNNDVNAKTTEQQPSTMTINKLPVELLCRILRSLRLQQRVRVERVCHQWRRIGTDPYEWRDQSRLVINFGNAFDSDNWQQAVSGEITMAFALAKHVGPWLRGLNVRNYPMEGGMRFGIFYARLTEHTPRLQYLLIDDSIHWSQWASIGRHTPNLPALKIDLDSPMDTPPMKAFNELFHACSKLRSLSLFSNKYFDQGGNGTLARLPAGLQRLSLSISNDRVLKQFLVRAGTDCPELRIFSLIACTRSDISAELMTLKKQSLEFMAHLNLYNGNVQETNIPPLMALDFFANIKCLHLFNVNRKLLSRISTRCQRLEFLAFDHIVDIQADQFVHALGKLLPRRLKHLQFPLQFTMCDDGMTKEEEETGHEQQLHIEIETLLAWIAQNGNGTLQQLFVDGLKLEKGVADFLVNSVIRPCKSLTAITASICDEEEVNNLCAAIEALAREEKMGGGRIQRAWPIDVILPCQVHQFRRSQFVRWHGVKEEMAKELGRKMVRRICGCQMPIHLTVDNIQIPQHQN